jgi:mannonate dehydratase
MKLGLGLYRHMLDAKHFRFARQAGATHIVAHLVDYFPGRGDAGDDQPPDGARGWGPAGDPDRLWTLDELLALRRGIEAEGLKLEAIENFDPAHWSDVLLDGPRRAEHIENCKTIVRRLGEAGIPVMGYNFSLAGVAGRITGPFARGGAESVGVDGPDDRPLPAGMAWNMVVDPDAPDEIQAPVSSEDLWDRARRFLAELAPVAEQAGVTLAAHPDDPPFERLRGTPRLVWKPELFQRMIDLHPSPANRLEFCIGTLAEMQGGDLYETIAHHAARGHIAYAHLRNVQGRVPRYHETFLDEGDVDMRRVLRILAENNFDGVIIPDHTPRMSCDAPWHAGMAWALGWMSAAIGAL